MNYQFLYHETNTPMTLFFSQHSIPFINAQIIHFHDFYAGVNLNKIYCPICQGQNSRRHQFINTIGKRRSSNEVKYNRYKNSSLAHAFEVALGIDPERVLAFLHIEPLLLFDAPLLQEVQTGFEGVQAKENSSFKRLLVQERVDYVKMSQELPLLWLHQNIEQNRNRIVGIQSNCFPNLVILIEFADGKLYLWYQVLCTFHFLKWSSCLNDLFYNLNGPKIGFLNLLITFYSIMF